MVYFGFRAYPWCGHRDETMIMMIVSWLLWQFWFNEGSMTDEFWARYIYQYICLNCSSVYWTCRKCSVAHIISLGLRSTLGVWQNKCLCSIPEWNLGYTYTFRSSNMPGKQSVQLYATHPVYCEHKSGTIPCLYVHDI